VKIKTFARKIAGKRKSVKKKEKREKMPCRRVEEFVCNTDPGGVGTAFKGSVPAGGKGGENWGGRGKKKNAP